MTVSKISSTGVIVSAHLEMRQIFQETTGTVQRHLSGVLRAMGLTGVVTSDVESLTEGVCYSTGVSVTSEG